MLRTLAISLALLLSTSAHAKPHIRKPTKDSKWMRECIHERTGPVGGVSIREARAICKAEQPDDEVEAAKAQLALARANAKLLKARERVNKAIEACEQAVVDICVAGAAPDGSTSCEDADLKAQFAQCH